MATSQQDAARRRQEQQEERRRRQAALAAGGALAVGATAAGVARTAVALPSTAARTSVGAAIVAGLVVFLADRWRRQEAWLRQQLAARLNTAPTATAAGLSPEEVIRQAVDEERRREEAFTAKATERFMRGVAAALALPPRSRERALRMLLAQEERFAQQRAVAAATRAFAAIDRAVLKADSPQGAFWRLSETVREHTIGCLRMGGKFWPWQVLDRVHPPRHGGCPCSLVGYGQAVAQGLMIPGAVQDVRAAISAAAHVVMEGAIEPGDDLGKLRDLLFEAWTVDLGDQLISAGLSTLPAVERVRETLELGLDAGERAEELGGLGLGRDDGGVFVYSHAGRSASFASAADVPLGEVERLTGGS